MSELQSDEDVGLASALQSDEDVGLGAPESQFSNVLSHARKVGSAISSFVDVAPEFGDAISHTHQAINAVKRFTGLGDQPPPDVDVPTVTSVMKAFGHEAKDAWGPEKLGISDASAKILSDQGWFRKEGRDSYNPFGAFNELLFGTIVGAGDILLRSGAALLRGSQGAVFEATGSRDLAALPEAFFGTPHPLGIPKGFPSVKVREPTPGMKITVKAGGLTSEGVVPLEPSFTAEVSGIEAYHGSPHDFGAFDISHIGAGEGSQSYGHGLYFAQNPEVADFYQKALAGKGADDLVQQLAQQALQFADHDRAKAANGLRERAASEKAEPFSGISPDAMLDAAKMIDEGLEKKGSIYKVRINADPSTFLDWDRPLSEQGEFVRQRLEPLLKNFNDKDVAVGQYLYSHLGYREPIGEAGYKILQPYSGEQASAALFDSGIPGIKYLDQGSRRLSDAELGRAITEKQEELARRQAMPADQQYGMQNLQMSIDDLKAQLGKPQSSNYVLFDDKLVQITHKNGVEVPDVAQARDLGVIGPERPPITEGTPEEAARRLMNADEPKWECW